MSALPKLPKKGVGSNQHGDKAGGADSPPKTRQQVTDTAAAAKATADATLQQLANDAVIYREPQIKRSDVTVAPNKSKADLASARRELDAAENPQAVARLSWDAAQSAILTHMQNAGYRPVHNKSHHMALVTYAEQHLVPTQVLTERQAAETETLRRRRKVAAYPHESETDQPVDQTEAKRLLASATSISTAIHERLQAQQTKRIPPPPPRP